MIRLVALLILIFPSFLFAQNLTFAGRVVVNSGYDDARGLSGIEMLSDDRFIAISDRGRFVQGELTRTEGRLKSVTLEQPQPILDSKGDALDRRNIDAEGLALGRDGTIYVSFEGNHRIMRHASVDVPPTFLPKHDDFRGLQNNSGLEALAINNEGVIIAIPERSGLITRPFPVYSLKGTDWVISGGIPRVGEYLVTGADFGPDGRLYVLERSYNWPAGFAARIRRFEYSSGAPTNGQTIFESRSQKRDNMEGISVWRDADGQVRLILVSDDNFNALQRTVLVEYLVID